MSEKIQKAGAIVFSSNDKSKIALLHRGKENDWSFPKGHVDPGEDTTQTMTREIKEETGLSVEIINTLPDLEFVHSNGNLITTKMFLVRSQDDSELKLEFKNDEIQWVPLSEVEGKLSYDNLKVYFKSILEIIKTESASL